MADRPRTYNVLNILMKFHAFPSEVMGKYCLVEATGARRRGCATQSPRR
jgi:hypothetical protein